MACILLCTATHSKAQTKGYYTQYYGNQPDLVEKARQWAESGEWRNGFQQAKPHSSVNLVDFYLQYHKKPEAMESTLQLSGSYRPARHRKG